MADLAVAGLEVVTGDRGAAAQMRAGGFVVMSFGGRAEILGFLLHELQGLRCVSPAIARQHHLGEHAAAPVPEATPVVRIAVVARVVLFVLPRDRLFSVDVRAILDLLLGDSDVQLPSLPIYLANSDRRYQYFFALEPTAGFNHQITHDPSRIVHVNILYMPDCAVDGSNGVGMQIREGSQHDFAP